MNLVSIFCNILWYDVLYVILFYINFNNYLIYSIICYLYSL